MIFVDEFIKRKCQSNWCCITEVRGGLLPLAVGFFFVDILDIQGAFFNCSA